MKTIFTSRTARQSRAAVTALGVLAALTLGVACDSDTPDNTTDGGVSGSGGEAAGGSGGEGGEGNAGTAGTSNAGTDAGDPSDLDAGNEDVLAINGVYDSEYGATVTITNTRYEEVATTYSFDDEIVNFDNEDQYFITGTEMGYNKILWELRGETLYLCTALFGQATEAEASVEEDGADREDLTTGCAGFPWTAHTPAGADADGGL